MPDEKMTADLMGAFPISPEMTKAGEMALSKVFSQDAFAKHDIVNSIYWAMRAADKGGPGDREAAAAPDMYAALESFVFFEAGIKAKEFDVGSMTVGELFDNARAALAKARGE